MFLTGNFSCVFSFHSDTNQRECQCLVGSLLCSVKSTTLPLKMDETNPKKKTYTITIHSTWCETFLALRDSLTVSPAHPHTITSENLNLNLVYKVKLDHDKRTSYFTTHITLLGGFVFAQLTSWLLTLFF